MPKQEGGMRNAVGGRRRRSGGVMGAVSGALLTVSTYTQLSEMPSSGGTIIGQLRLSIIMIVTD